MQCTIHGANSGVNKDLQRKITARGMAERPPRRDNGGMLDELNRRLDHWLWSRRPASTWDSRATLIGRYCFVMVREAIDGQLSMRAMSLVYTTLLSIVPILALGFSLLKALGAQNALEPMLMNMLAPLGDQADEVVTSVIGFVENMKVGVLGSLGVGLLLYTAISMIQKVEGAFNFIWRIEESRGIGQRFGEYLSVLTVGPVLVFVAMGITASLVGSDQVQALASIEPFGFLIDIGARLMPYLVMIGLFTFLYTFIPNTRVRLGAAAGGGIFAGILWQSASLVFASFVAGATNYNAVYSGFAIVIFLLIWLYLGWQIMLLGCLLAFHLQHPEHLTRHRRSPMMPGRATEALGAAVVFEVGERFLNGHPPATAEQISRRLQAEPEHVDRVIELLKVHGVLIAAGEDQVALMPARDLAEISVADLWRTLRRGLAPEAARETLAPSMLAAGEMVGDMESSYPERYGSVSVRDWIRHQAGD